MLKSHKRRLDDLQSILGPYTGTEGCGACGAPRRLKRKTILLVMEDKIYRCMECNRLLEPADGNRPLDVGKVIYLGGIEIGSHNHIQIPHSVIAKARNQLVLGQSERC
jgi:hypothetical protein